MGFPRTPFLTAAENSPLYRQSQPGFPLSREPRLFVCVKSARRPFYFACFMLRLMRFFFSSTSSTTTLTTSPTDTASEGWRMNLSDT